MTRWREDAMGKPMLPVTLGLVAGMTALAACSDDGSF